MRNLPEIIKDLETRKANGNLSPVDAANYLVELVPHHKAMMDALNEAMNIYSVAIATAVHEGKPVATAKVLTDGSDVGKSVRAAKVDLAYIEEYISNLKYLSRAIEKEWQAH